METLKPDGYYVSRNNGQRGRFYHDELDASQEVERLIAEGWVNTSAEPMYCLTAVEAMRSDDSARIDWIASQVQEYGDGYTEPREAGWHIQWQQERPTHYWPGLRSWVDEQRIRAGQLDGDIDAF